ncbi:MAG TPA: hypothetical protein VFD70_27720, partial [Anaerolineae bacterium]|nr:hypothetical protein [Anaerolineae bacterium]
EPMLVLRDVINNLVTPECAQQIYGVVVRAHPWRVDANGTRKQREAIYNQRKKSTERTAGVSQAKRGKTTKRAAQRAKRGATR